MINIQQNTGAKELSSLLKKCGSVEFNINEQLIMEDIARFEKEKSETFNRINRDNLGHIIKYLQQILKKVKRGRLRVDWKISDNIIESYPIKMMSIPEYNMMITDYISSQSEKLILVDYSQLSDIIAFEMMYKDLGETHETMEEKLRGVGIIGVHESSILTDLFEESIYKLSKKLRISDSVYAIPLKSKTIIQDYFYRKQFDTKSYKDVVSYSCKVAMTIILESLMSRASKESCNFKICSISEVGISIMVDEKQADKVKDMIETVCVRTFGRRFEVKPTIQVF